MMRTIYMFTLSAAVFLAACQPVKDDDPTTSTSRTASIPPAFQLMYIDSNDGDTEFRRAIYQEFIGRGIRVVDIRTQANTILRISREQVERRATSVGGARGTPREYQLVYSVTYVVTQNGKELFFPETLSVARHYTAGATGGGFAQQQEETVLREAMARDLVRQAMRRLSGL